MVPSVIDFDSASESFSTQCQVIKFVTWDKFILESMFSKWAITLIKYRGSSLLSCPGHTHLWSMCLFIHIEAASLPDLHFVQWAPVLYFLILLHTQPLHEACWRKSQDGQVKGQGWSLIDNEQSYNSNSTRALLLQAASRANGYKWDFVRLACLIIFLWPVIFFLN